MPNTKQIDDSGFPLTFVELEKGFPQLAYDFRVYLEENDLAEIPQGGLFILEEPEYVEHTYKVVPTDLFYVNGQPRVFTYADTDVNLFWSTSSGRSYWGDLS
jgi:hypothetical protein